MTGRLSGELGCPPFSCQMDLLSSRLCMETSIKINVVPVGERILVKNFFYKFVPEVFQRLC